MIKKVLKKILYKNKADSETYIKYLRKKGCTIGKETKIYSPRNVIIDETRPWLIEIGENVQITDGVKILTHGYDWSVFKVKYGEVLGSAGKVKIGNNVFIGINTTILKGTFIGDDIIIGANSLVNKNLYESGVYGGNPIKYIMSLEEYYKKRKEKQLDEAYECAIRYYEVYNKWPGKEIFQEFFWLFEERKITLNSTFHKVMKLEGNEEMSYEKFKNTKSLFNNYDEFINYVKNKYYDNDKTNN